MPSGNLKFSAISLVASNEIMVAYFGTKYFLSALIFGYDIADISTMVIILAYSADVCRNNLRADFYR